VADQRFWKGRPIGSAYAGAGHSLRGVKGRSLTENGDLRTKYVHYFTDRLYTVSHRSLFNYTNSTYLTHTRRGQPRTTASIVVDLPSPEHTCTSLLAYHLPVYQLLQLIFDEQQFVQNFRCGRCCCRKASCTVSDDDSIRTSTANWTHCGTSTRVQDYGSHDIQPLAHMQPITVSTMLKTAF